MNALVLVCLAALVVLRALLIVVLWREHVLGGRAWVRFEELQRAQRAEIAAMRTEMFRKLQELVEAGEEQLRELERDEQAECTACGRWFGEDTIERSQGWCPNCGARWVGTEDRKPC